jgi:hypothetical protein
MRRTLLYWTNLLSSYRLYWWLRATVKRLRFGFGTRIFSLRSAVDDASANASILWSLFLVALRQVLVAALLAAATLYFSSQLLVLSPFPSVPFFDRLRPVLQLVPKENSSVYDGLLIGVITVVGLFLTLYFTNLGVLAQTVFPSLPNKLRSLLVEERTAYAYVQFLMFLTLISLIFLGYGAVTGYRPNLVIVLIVTLSLFAVQAFARLSVRSYRFFDPTLLIWDLISRFGKWSRYASVGAYRWNDPSFQDHYRMQATEVLRGIGDLVDVAEAEQKLRKESLSATLVRISGALDGYLCMKRLIPSDSAWFPRRPQYRSWYLSSSSSVGMATQTETSPPPEMKPDNYWVEIELLRLLSESLSNCLADGRNVVALSILDKLSAVFATLGRNGELDFGARELARLRSIVVEAIDLRDEKAELAASEVSRHPEWYALADCLGLLPISLFLGFREGIEALDLAALSQSLDSIEWSNPESIYRLGLPSFCLDQIEDLKRRIDFEILSEGHPVSAPWYIRQLMYLRLATVIRDQFTTFLDESRSFYLSFEQWMGKGRSIHAAAIIARGLEFSDKILVHLPTLERFSGSLDQARIEKSIRWPEWDWTKKREQVGELGRQLEITRAQLIPELSVYASIKDFPDYFSRAVHTTGQACFTALVGNDAALFSALFPRYFDGVFRTLTVLGNETTGWNPNMAALAQVEPVIDLCTLSGYAYFMAEYHQDSSLWEACRTVWERYLSGDLKKARLSWLAVNFRYSKSLFAITDRNILRTQWKMAIDRAIKVLPRKRSVLSRRTHVPIEKAVVDHPSLLVRVTGGVFDDMLPSFIDGLDIFVELYLSTLDEGKGPDYGVRKDLVDSMERWKRNEESGEDD